MGLVYGDPSQAVGKVLFAVDPTIEVAREAASWGADLLVVHHPLFLRGVHGFAETTPKGRTLATLVRAGCALFTAHTNADRAEPGVSDAMAAALGLTDVRPLRAEGDAAGQADRVRPGGRRRPGPGRAVRGRGGADRGLRVRLVHGPGEGRFRPLEGASPTIGRVGDLEVVGEARIEVVLDRRRRGQVIAAMLVAHPYETPAWDVVELADGGTASTGAGRVGDVEPTTLRDFAAYVARRAAADRARRPRVRRPGPGRPAGGRGRGSGRLPARRRAGQRRRRVRDQRPAPPPRDRVRREGRAGAGRRRRTGPPSGPGCRRWRRGSGQPWIRWRPASARSAPMPGVPRLIPRRHPESRPRRPADAARPPGARLARGPAAPPARHAARARRPRRADDDPARPRRPGPRRAHRRRRPDRRADQGRLRRRAGQDPPRPRPQPDGPGPGLQPPRPRAHAARDGVAGASDHHASRTRSSR